MGWMEWMQIRSELRPSADPAILVFQDEQTEKAEYRGGNQEEKDKENLHGPEPSLFLIGRFCPNLTQKRQRRTVMDESEGGKSKAHTISISRWNLSGYIFNKQNLIVEL